MTAARLDVSDVQATFMAARCGDPRAVGRLLSLVESASPWVAQLSALVTPYAGTAHVIGVTGAPGVGKSTATAALVRAFRRAGQRVGVLAVDPSSPFSGGALLGDRVRMQEFAGDGEVFVRSMASRGHLGGLAVAAAPAIRVLHAVGCEVVIVETVGVGQGEVEIAGLADTTLVLLAPGMGDGIQAAKAGLLEIADIFVINKADRDGADNTVRDVKNMLALGGPHSAAGSWRPMVVKATAIDQAGVDELVTAIARHLSWLRDHDGLVERRRARTSAEILAVAMAVYRARLEAVRGPAELSVLADRVVAGELDPYAAAKELGAAIQ